MMKNHERNIRTKFVPPPPRRNRTRSPYNAARIQREILCSIVERVGLFANSDKMINLAKTLREVKDEKGDLCPSTGTMYYWYLHYQQFGELPIETRKRIGIDRTSTTKWTPTQIAVLKEIIEYNPHFYLDEISKAYHQRFPDCPKTHNSIWITLRRKLNYVLKRYTEIAAQ